MKNRIHFLIALCAVLPLALFSCISKHAIAPPNEIVLEAQAATSNGSPEYEFRRYKLPDPTHNLVSVGHDAIYQHPPSSGATVADTYIEMLPDKTGHYGRAAIISDNAPYPRKQIRNCIIQAVGKPNDELWGIRDYGMEEGINPATGQFEPSVVDTVLVRNMGREHGFYSEVWRGLAQWIDCTSVNCAAQGLQLRLTNNRADIHWPNPKRIEIIRFTAMECGQARGIGRAGASLTIHEQGPESDIYIEDVQVRTIFQTAVKINNGVTYNSFGGIFVGYCKSLTIQGGYVGMRPPSDRDAVQLYNFSDKSPTRTGPAVIVVNDFTMDFGGDIAVRRGDGHSISITNCTAIGDCRIKVFDRVNGQWKLTETIPLEQGLVWP